MTIRPLSPADFATVARVIDAWWGGRPVRSALPRVFFEHFTETSFALVDDGALKAFLVGFRSQSQPHVAYIHFVGVDPATRGQGYGRLLYERFFERARELGCTEARCITSPVNADSVAFHQRMGFTLEPGDGQSNGFPVSLDYAGEGDHRVLFRKPLS